MYQRATKWMACCPSFRQSFWQLASSARPINRSLLFSLPSSAKLHHNFQSYSGQVVHGLQPSLTFDHIQGYSPWEWPHRDGSSSSVSPIPAPIALCDRKTQSCEGENQGVVEGNQDNAQVAAERGTGTRLVLGDNADPASDI